MKETTQLPIWVVVVLTVAPALITGAAAVLGAWLAGARRAAQQLDRWRRREETMRLVRWAADKTTSQQERERLLALSVLDAIDKSKPAMLQDEDQGIVDAVLDAAVADATSVVEAYPDDAATTKWRWPPRMSRRVPGVGATFVSPSEVKAAQMKVRRMLERGEQPSDALLAIANASAAANTQIEGLDPR